MRKLTMVSVLAATIATVAATATAAGPVDLWNDHESGDGKPLTSGVGYRASLFPLPITIRATDELWEGAQDLHTSGIHEGEPRKGGTFAFVILRHKYARDAKGKVTNWGRGRITIETGFAPSGSVEATMARLRGRLEDFRTVSDVSAVHIAGFRGLSYDGHLKDGARSFHRFVPFSSSDGSRPTTDSRKIFTNYGKGPAFRVTVLNVRGRTVVVYLDSETAPPEKFPGFLHFANRLLATLTVSAAKGG